MPSLLTAFGATATGARRARMQRSPRWKDGAFENDVPTLKAPPGTLLETLKRQLLGKEQRVPPAPPPIVALDARSFDVPPASGLRVTWLGHATSLLEIDGLRILMDPVWAERASPVQWAGPTRFHAPPIRCADLPPLDVVLLSHDHYDHLDDVAIRTIAAAQPHARFVMPLGVGAHLEAWGVDAGRITELDWWESTTVESSGGETLTLTATPARHFSGRGALDALGRGNPTLWASFVLATARHRVFFSGDSGPYDSGFTAIGERHGPFDLALVKIGAYGDTWPDIHLNPEQAVRAHQQLGARVLLPIHWGTFNLAFHAWDEPAERVVAAARAANVTLVVPRPGEAVEPASPPALHPWWRALAPNTR